MMNQESIWATFYEIQFSCTQIYKNKQDEIHFCCTDQAPVAPKPVSKSGAAAAGPRGCPVGEVFHNIQARCIKTSTSS
jgi:hypothetical protein